MIHNFGTDEHLHKRKLTNACTNAYQVWGYVVGMVVAGHFAGFNRGYAYGLGSMIVAHILGSVFMIAFSMKLTELATAIPFVGGFATYAALVFNEDIACIVGYVYALYLLLVGAESTQFCSNVLQALLSPTSNLVILYYFLTLSVCIGINLYPKAFFNVITVTSFLSCALVIISLLAAAQNFSYNDAFGASLYDSNGSLQASSEFLPYGSYGVFASIPYALYLISGFESLPYCVEETADIATSIPKGMTAANVTIIIVSWISLVVSAGMPPGVAGLQAVLLPYSAILTHAFKLSNDQAVALISLPAAFSSQLATLYTSSRVIYGLSRGGYLPTILSLTSRTGAPYLAIATSSVIFCLFSIIFLLTLDAGSYLSLFVVATILLLFIYLGVPVAYILIKKRLPALHRPWRIESRYVALFAATLSFGIACAMLFGNVAFDYMWQWDLLWVLVALLCVAPVCYFVVRKCLKESPDRAFVKTQTNSFKVMSG
ncbi:amino acid/polyamine transporter I [Chytriomyces cf. hyalinus JEL632]|nr:amino acid/polyamine transporter I [Chytriomyces cf. hyalinus JEL632]